MTPWKMDEKLKSENMQKKEQFCMFMLYFESNQGSIKIIDSVDPGAQCLKNFGCALTL